MSTDTTLTAAFLAAFVAIGVGAFTVWSTIVERRRQCLRDLQRDFFYDAALVSRLKAERMLYVDRTYDGKNFKQLFEGGMPEQDYLHVARVLNLFRILNEFKESRFINEREAREAFGWVYEWWWSKVISQHIAGIENDPDWAPHIKRHDWLLPQRLFMRLPDVAQGHAASPRS